MPRCDSQIGIPAAYPDGFDWSNFETPGVEEVRDSDATGGLFTEFLREPKKRAFLIAYAEIGVIVRAARAIGVTRQHVMTWRRGDPKFAKAFDEAHIMSAEMVLVDALRERGISGVRRLKFNKDGEAILDPHTNEPYEERHFSDAAAIFLLKGEMPHRYGDKVKQEHSGEVVNNLTVKFYLPENNRGPGAVVEQGEPPKRITNEVVEQVVEQAAEAAPQALADPVAVQLNLPPNRR